MFLNIGKNKIVVDTACRRYVYTVEDDNIEVKPSGWLVGVWNLRKISAFLKNVFKRSEGGTLIFFSAHFGTRSCGVSLFDADEAVKINIYLNTSCKTKIGLTFEKSAVEIIISDGETAVGEKIGGSLIEWFYAKILYKKTKKFYGWVRQEIEKIDKLLYV